MQIVIVFRTLHKGRLQSTVVNNDYYFIRTKLKFLYFSSNQQLYLLHRKYKPSIRIVLVLEQLLSGSLLFVAHSSTLETSRERVFSRSSTLAKLVKPLEELCHLQICRLEYEHVRVDH